MQFQTTLIASLLLILSKMPSHPSAMKSWSFLILKALISGVAIKTLGLPPKSSNFASTSPKDLETDSLPGKILSGPTMGAYDGYAIVLSVELLLPGGN